MLEKYSKFVPLSLFCGYAIKGLINGTTLQDAAIFLVLGALAAVFDWKIQNKRIDALHQRCNKIDEVCTALYKAQDDLKSRLSASQMAQGMRPAAFGSMNQQSK
jgi:hypothetical protein